MRQTTLVTLIAGLVLWADVAAAQESQAPSLQRESISFGGTEPLTVSWADMSKGVPLEVFNNTPRSITMVVQLSAFVAENGATRLTPEDLAATIQPAELTVAAGQSERVTINAVRATPPADGSYTGSVVAFAKGGGVLTRRTLVLTVAAQAKVEPEPLVKALTVTVYRFHRPSFVPRWGHWHRYRGPDEIVLPLKATTANVDLSALDELGVIKKGDSIATVKHDGMPQKIDGHYGVPIKIDGLGEPGEYEGELDLLSDDDKAGDITLKVVYSDTIWLPLIVLLLGVGAGALISRTLGVTVRYLDLRTRLALIRRALENARPKFLAVAGTKDWNDYDITPAVDEEERKSRDRIDALRASYPTAIPDSEVTTLQTELEATRKTVDSFGTTFADSLQKLDATLAEIASAPSDTLPRLPNPAPVDHPKIDEALQPLLHGAKVPNLDAFRTLIQTVTDGKDAAAAWRNYQTEISRAYVELERFRPPPPRHPTDPPTQAPKFEAATGELESVYRELWERIGPAQARADTLKTRIEAAWLKIDAARDEAKTRSAGLDEAISRTLGQRAREIEAVPLPTEDEGLPRDEATRLAQKRDWTRWLLIAAAVAVALVTGLNSLYVGKGFGTTWDYINLFVWGVTTKLIFDLVVNGLNALNLVRVARQ
jgi:hypothetical protein